MSKSGASNFDPHGAISAISRSKTLLGESGFQSSWWCYNNAIMISKCCELTGWELTKIEFKFSSLGSKKSIKWKQS